MPPLNPLPLPPSIKQFYLPSKDLTYYVLSAGNPKRPLVLCLHGFPELAYSWRKIMPTLAAEGYHVVAYDQRGYGRTTGWDTQPFDRVDLGTFSFRRLVRDAVIFVNALGYKEVACVLGHDFGAVGASLCAMIRPDIFKSVVLMSHPFKGTPSLPFNTGPNYEPDPTPEDALQALAKLPEPRKHYKYYYSTAEAAPEMDGEGLHEFLRGYFYLKSADWKGNNPHPLKAWNASELAKLPLYYVMPLKGGMRDAVNQAMIDSNAEVLPSQHDRWLPDSDLAVYVESWQHTGFQGGLNWYRIGTGIDALLDMDLYAGKKIDVPCLFISGKQDWGTYQEPGAVENMENGTSCSKFRGVELVDGAGHWVQQEQPEKVLELVKKFLKDVKVDAVTY